MHRVTALHVFLMGIVWTVFIGFFTALMVWDSFKCDAKTEGICIYVSEVVNTSRDSKTHRTRTSISYQPTVEYTVDGVTYTVSSNTSSSSYKNAEGKTYVVKYNSSDPEIATLPLPLGAKVFLSVFMFVGIFMLVRGAIGLLFGR